MQQEEKCRISGCGEQRIMVKEKEDEEPYFFCPFCARHHTQIHIMPVPAESIAVK